MSTDDKLVKKIENYQEAAKENPNIDIGMLMLNALQNEKQNSVSAKTKRWAYLISIGAPPFGIFFALKYFFSDEDDAKAVAWICVILTVISLVIIWILGKLFFSSSGTSLDQIQQIKPADIKQLYE